MPKSITRLYLDVETTSGIDHIDSKNPWKNCNILGISLTWDDNPESYYIPIRHRGNQRFANLNVEQVHAWLKYIFSNTKMWINHNIKYDVHVIENELNINLDAITKVDTLSFCKLMPQEEKYSYDLTVVAKDYLYKDIKPLETTMKLYVKWKDYGYVPIDIMKPYACCDVETCRELYHYCKENLPEECYTTWELEQRTTEILIDIERRGMRVDQAKLELHYVGLSKFLPMLQEQIAKDTGIKDIRPHVNGDLEEYFIHQKGYPIYERTEKEKKPSFGENALLAYKLHEPELVKKIMYYKDLHKQLTGFLTPYLKLNVNGLLHGDYNQMVSTGRESIRKPALQTLPKSVREFIIPNDPGCRILNFDFSQIEFRTIVHYIENQKAIAAYNNDPKTDFHDWMSSMCNVDRDPAKTLNFLLGYGGGRNRCINELKSLDIIVQRAMTEGLNIDALANSIYNIYHQTLPELSPTSYTAKEVCSMRGYVKTFFGRRRYLPPVASRKAFNSACQGTAADLMKMRTLDLYDRLKNTDAYINGIVHDSWSIIAPDDSLAPELVKILEQRPEGFSVPIMADFTQSNRNWRDCFEKECDKCGTWGKLKKPCKVCNP